MNMGRIPPTAEGHRPDDDRLREECGVFGIYGHPDAAAITALGLHALQHRGQEAAGIVSYDGTRFHSERRLGLVGDTFSRREVIERLPGDNAVGHVRYSTTGGTLLRNVQPLFSETGSGGFAIGHNGNLTNGLTLRGATSCTRAPSCSPPPTPRWCCIWSPARGATVSSTASSTRCARSRAPMPSSASPARSSWARAIRSASARSCSASSTASTSWRRRPARSTSSAPATCATWRTARSSSSPPTASRATSPSRPCRPRPCIFEYIYFARPDSIVGGRSVYDVRKNLGLELAREHPAAADVVIPVPDSGVPAALGYSQQSGIPYELGIIRNHYVGRTFIEPTQQIRELGVRLKHSANRAAVAGKRIMLIDDSLVRGTTSIKIVRMMREAGAREVHFRIASPPITHSDYYGIDTPEREKLLAASHDVEGMRQYIGADSLAFLSLDGLYRAMGEEKRDPMRPQFTDHCFTGDYPTALTDRTGEVAPKQLSLLAEAS